MSETDAPRHSWPPPHPVIDAPYGPRYTAPPAPATPAPGRPFIPRLDPLPPSPPKSKKWQAMFVAVCLAVAVIGGIVAVQFVEQSGAPTKWDARVADLATFVERTTGETFVHPVRVRFLADKDFVPLVTQTATALTDAQRQAYAEQEAVGRAFGWYTGSTKVFDETNTLNAAGILAYYSYDSREVVARADQPDASTLPVDLRVTIVHELIHALQDQRLDVRGVRDRATTSSERDAATALIEGHAVWVENRYVASLTAQEQTAYYDATATSGDDVGQQTKTVPAELSVPLAAPYVYGPILVDAASRTRAGIEQLFTRPPSAMDQALDPRAYFADDRVETLADPVVTGTKLTVATAGIVRLYLTLATVFDPREAWDVAAGWGNDKYLPYKEADGTICVAWHIAADTPAAATKLYGALTTWGASRVGSRTVIAKPADYVSVTTCDPGTSSTQKTPGRDVSRSFYIRSTILGSLLERSGDLDTATCATSALMGQYGLDDLEQATEDVIASADALVASCG